MKLIRGNQLQTYKMTKGGKAMEKLQDFLFNTVTIIFALWLIKQLIPLL